MNIFKSGLGIVVVGLAVVAILAGACGPREVLPTPSVPTAPPTPNANQPPEISSLTANPSGVSYGGSAAVSCIATDPDGDVVNYSWSASGGDISGVGDTVTWVAPNKGGNFYITVIVSDSKGGETEGSVMIAVSAAVSTVTITPVAEETGTVRSDGATDNSRTWAGDDEKDRGYCAFWSFDIRDLVEKNIQSASLKFTTKDVVGDPFSSTTGLGGLRFWKVRYSDGLPGFWYTGSNLLNTPAQNAPPTLLDVTQEIANAAAAPVPGTRFQVEALFQNRVTNGNRVAQFIEWSGVVLEVTYSEK